MEKFLARTSHPETTPLADPSLGALIVAFSIVLFWIDVPMAIYLAFGLASALACLAVQVLIGIGVLIWEVFCL